MTLLSLGNRFRLPSPIGVISVPEKPRDSSCGRPDNSSRLLSVTSGPLDMKLFEFRELPQVTDSGGGDVFAAQPEHLNRWQFLQQCQVMSEALSVVKLRPLSADRPLSC